MKKHQFNVNKLKLSTVLKNTTPTTKQYTVLKPFFNTSFKVNNEINFYNEARMVIAT